MCHEKEKRRKRRGKRKVDIELLLCPAIIPDITKEKDYLVHIVELHDIVI